MPETAKISLMSQYVPYGDSGKYPELQRRVTKREYESVLNEAIALGFGDRLYAQERASSQEKYIPSWDF
jgi:putative pyruvate formate lyase activating enzyme